MTNSGPDEVSPGDLRGYEVVVAVCGGIAAYKVCGLVSTMVQRGVGVTVAMTKSATRFVGPVTFQALTGRQVLTSLWHHREAGDIQHIALTGSADVLLVAPATANVIGKINNGVADDLVTTLVIGAASPVVLAPSMNDRMWTNPIVQKNLAGLAESGYEIIAPGEGWLACRSQGPGRLAEPDRIFAVLVSLMTANPPKNSGSCPPVAVREKKSAKTAKGRKQAG